MWVVWENMNNEYWQFKSKEDAIKQYEAVKEWIMEDDLSGQEEVWLFKAEKVSQLKEDKSIEEDPKEHGFDYWAKWEEILLNKDE